MNRYTLAAFAAVVVFGSGIVGALTPSYLHLSDWWRPMMPPGWEHLSTVAALVTEGVIVACGGLRALERGRLTDDGRRFVVNLEWWAVVAAIYVNARWAMLRSTAPALTLDAAGLFAVLDTVAGAAMLPLFARSCFVALGLALDACRAGVTEALDNVMVQAVDEPPVLDAPAVDDVALSTADDVTLGDAPDDVALPALDTAPPDVNPPPPPSTVKPTSTDPVARWHDAVNRAGSSSPSDVARAVGVSRQTASTWKRQAGGDRPQAKAA